MKVVNLFAGPGVGKSTTAAALFAELKYRGVNAELVTEAAKDAAWEGRSQKYWSAQNYISAEQSWRLQRLAGDVDIVVTDSPLPLGLIYMPDDYSVPSLRFSVMEDFLRYNNLNVLLKRNKPYNQRGRNQTEVEAKEVDVKIAALLRKWEVDYHPLDFGRSNPQDIIQMMQMHKWHEEIPQLA